MSKTNIGYVDYSCNPYLWRCQKRSPGCANCYMMALARRYGQDPTGPFGTRFDKAEAELAKMPPGSTVFLNDMSDTYLEAARDADVMHVHELPVNFPHLYFMIVTKRPERAYYMRHRLSWPENLWLVVSVENEDYLWRIDYALLTPAAHVGVSAEPLLGSLKWGLFSYLFREKFQSDPAFLAMSDRQKMQATMSRETLNRYHIGRRVRGIEWVITGGESGATRRRFNAQWVQEIVEMISLYSQHVCLFHKQGGARSPGQDRVLDGVTWNEIPTAFGGAGPTGPTPVPLVEPVSAGGVTQLALL
jgi:protein gp37